MKRFNVLLTKDQDDYLTYSSNQLGLTKAQYIRSRIDSAIRNNEINFEKKKEKKVFSFNFKLSKHQDQWLRETSKKYECTKGEILRCFLKTETNRQIKNEISKETPNPVSENINNLLKAKNYHKLNNYLVSLGKNTVINLGRPDFFINLISEIERNYPYISNELEILKIKFLWFIGESSMALSEADRLIKKYNESKNAFKIMILKGEILSDMGFGHKASSILKTAIENMPSDMESWYKIKAYNKLGLSLFYIEDLDKVRSRYEKSLLLATNEEEKGVTHRYLGSITYSQEEFSLARDHFIQGNKNLRLGNNTDEYFRLLLNYAQFEITQINWISAKKHLLKAIEIAEKIKHLPNLSWANRIIADVYFNLDEKEKAFSSIKKAEELGIKSGGVSLISKSYLRHAKYLVTMNEFNKASELLTKARVLEKQRISDKYNYNSVSRWHNYINFINEKDVNFTELHNQSIQLKRKHHVIDESLNNYILGFMYFNSKDNEEKEKGERILKKVHSESMIKGSHVMQFSTESALRFNKFVII